MSWCLLLEIVRYTASGAVDTVVVDSEQLSSAIALIDSDFAASHNRIDKVATVQAALRARQAETADWSHGNPFMTARQAFRRTVHVRLSFLAILGEINDHRRQIHLQRIAPRNSTG